MSKKNIELSLEDEKKKQVIGLYGEMQLAMKLHGLGWQVHRGYIDEGIDFVISKYYCKVCEKFSNQFIRQESWQGQKAKCVTNLCEFCKKTKLDIVTKYLQVKTSEGKPSKKPNAREFSFHPKIRYDIDNCVFYVWIAVFAENENLEQSIIHYYIFHSSDVSRFDDMSLPTYQITDNQKTTLRINKQGEILNNGKKYSYECFKEFHNHFEILEKI
ncbi:hypothetical protein HCN_2024 [Helicobacter cinaedi PAGU611]|uniref:Uncharacterized protein n=2 Tax=Helicobacter TaxID=209 RepID=A0AAI8MPR2_9HELI|nr:hypothetical protein [Helicobacter cinaedi]EFR46140.1 hypothetical protein HCCG_00686 [Helicobacter cinaedi CCUG 18818 = ATCC BAA-847]QOQ90623.1 hypothetical protein HW260_10495 [Helicobacter cinaedi]BAM13172.1 hypothetical protein HCN_2024 [Helicobacter cinaedi PAGU611]BAM33498.1 hypothetical protein HCBAA847_2283 [Helicobacter cinaedi CCUG 18818 = ATCC BAA-847]BBB21100.1 hypothetical protein HC081234_22770 [Helicobacter cinaedi]